MYCPKCKHTETSVLDSRLTHEGKSVRRRRECDQCKYRFTTFERVELSTFVVVKRDGSREPYSREKVEKGVWRACEKRNVTQAQVDSLLNDLEEEWMSSGKEVPSKMIGESVMEKLKKLDEVAYIRFASVYKHFKDLESFKKEVLELMQ